MGELETERLIIRNHIPSDGDDLFEYLSLPEVYRFEPGNPLSREDTEKLLSRRCGGDDFLAVVLKDGGKMVGHLSFHLTPPEEFLTWELGYIFNPRYHNRGYCTEASSALIEYAFGRLGAHRIVAYCDPENIPSWKVLEKTGMIREGHFPRRAFFRRDGRGNPLWHDCYAYGILEGTKK